MPKKAAKTSKIKKSSKCDQGSVLCHPSTWLIAILSVALIVVCSISAYGFGKLGANTSLDSSKLAVFDHLLSDYMSNQEVDHEKPSMNEVTGYGISDEDGVFYATFDFVTYTLDADNMPIYDDLRHGIIYFWPDEERNTYSHAFSYHDDYYHPGGIYVKIGDHRLRDQFEPAE